MSSDSSGVGTLTTVVAVFLAIPLFMIGIAMLLMAFMGGGHMMGGSNSLQILMPLIPFTILGTIAHILYAYTRDSDKQRQETDRTLEELRSAYARGELSNEEFEHRRNRLYSQPNGTDGSEVSQQE